MVERRGPADAFLLADGYDLTASVVQGLNAKTINRLEGPFVGLGNNRDQYAPIGVRGHELTQGPAFFDTATGRSHAALGAPNVTADPNATARIVCFGVDGEVIGRFFTGYEGAFQSEYELLAAGEELQKAVGRYAVSGEGNDGVILQPVEAKTADWNTEGSPVDNAASSANGGVGYLQVVLSTGFTNFVGKIRHSTDDITYTDLITFTDNVSAPFAERIAVAGTVNRYLAFDGNVTGSGSITVFCGFSRS